MTQQPDRPQPSTATPQQRGAVDLSAFSGGSSASEPAGHSGSTWVTRISSEAELQQVLQLGAQVPVLIHLAAPSNPASAQIDQVLVPAVDQRQGRLVLAQADTEANPALLQIFGVPAGPVVVAVVGGQAIPLLNQPAPAEQVSAVLDEVQKIAVQNGLSGTVAPFAAAPEAQEAEPELPPLHAQAEAALGERDYDGALAAYEQALNENPGDDAAKNGISRVKLIQRTQAMDPQAVRANAAENPEDVQAQIDVADLDLLGGHVEDAFARLVRFIATHRDETREPARAHLVDLYAVVGEADPRVAESRRKLAMALF